MSARSVRLELPESKSFHPLTLEIVGSRKTTTVPEMLMRMTELREVRDDPGAVPVLVETARLLEALRIALTERQENQDLMSEGEIAISSRLDTVIDLLREVTIEKRNTTPTERER
jgi:hypothetical protein